MVTKAELHRHLWPDSFVSDASLLGLVKEVRRALNDDGDGTLIRTAHRIGYAFAAVVESGPSGSSQWAAWVMVGDVCVPLTKGENLIGRDAPCAVRVDLLGISRRHARIVVSGRDATIEDLGSKNGTMLDGQPVVRATALREGDPIQVGGAIVRFHFSATTSPKETLPTGDDAATNRQPNQAEADIVHSLLRELFSNRRRGRRSTRTSRSRPSGQTNARDAVHAVEAFVECGDLRNIVVEHHSRMHRVACTRKTETARADALADVP